MSEQEHILLDPLSGEEGTPAEPKGEQVDEAQKSAISKDIDALFGTPASDSGEEGGPTESGDDPFAVPTDGDGQPDYTGMSHEELAKMFQSKYDVAQAELNKATPKVARADSLESFVNDLYEKPEVRRAFLAQVEPDLIKPKDPYVVLEAQLKKEFGEEFIPDDVEAKRPFTESWRYYKRLDDLYTKEQKASTELPQTLEEMRTERTTKLSEQKTADADMKAKVLTTMKWSDNDYKSFGSWVFKLSAMDLAKIYNFAQQRKRGPVAPNLASQSGSRTSTPNEIASELTKFFG